MLKCAWCGNHSAEVRLYTVNLKSIFSGESPQQMPVCTEHQNALDAFTTKVNKWGRVFLFGVLALALLAFFVPEKFVGVIIIGIGLNIILFPFATPLTNRIFGIQKAIILLRIVGIAAIIFGCFLLFPL